MSVPHKIKKLTETFDYNLETYKKGSYNETQVRREFIDPFFQELGWDIANKQGYAETYKDVIHEDAIKVGGITKAPDYCFRIGGVRKFFLEAKKPAVNIKEDIHPAYQLRRYGWSAKLSLSILTDFEEFSVYDCRVKPVKTDKASHSRIYYLKYTDYVDNWEEIKSRFSREAILKGSFDKYVESKKTKKGTAEVDTAFLQEIERWRELLARNIALRNLNLTQRELNFAIQQTIDRIIFLRICEDRGIENYGRLMALQNGENVYKRLFQLFCKADDKYNSGLFHFKKEKNRENFDNITPNLIIDDKTLKDIFKNLYYPDSPYEFSVLPANILGQVYEKFLGKVIRLTAKHQAKIEEKPEVRKAGGVYYTPDYIVDYIVKQTVGKLVENKKPGPNSSVSKLKILDPACGSGSFLIGAYQFLLDWHIDRYVNYNTEKWSKGKKPRIYQTDKGEWRLTTDERKRILLNNIYGVDIDQQAVEVTKLSLLLKVLEGEDEQSIGKQITVFQDRVLPDLSNNIKCGNSLIGSDFYVNQQTTFNEEEMYRVNAFDWEDEFSGIMKNGGFDAVIGNPPYFSIDDTWGKKDVKLSYIKEAYHTIYNDKTDILFYFLGKAIHLSKGKVGFIVSRAFLEAYKANKLRLFIANNSNLEEIIDFQNYHVFKGIGITTCLLFLDHQLKSKANVFKYKSDKEPPELSINNKSPESFYAFSKEQSDFSQEIWMFTHRNIQKLIDKIDKNGVTISDILIIGKGMETGRNNVFEGIQKSDLKKFGLKQACYFERARNSDIQRYYFKETQNMLIYLEDYKSFSELPYKIQQYLSTKKEELQKRAAYKRNDCEWWKYTWPLHKEYIERDKIYTPYMAKRNRFALDKDNKFLGLTDTTVLFDNGQNESMEYILGLLNSKLLTFRYKFLGKLKSGGVLEYFWNQLSKVPIKIIDFLNPTEKAHHDQMVNLVDQMLNLNKKLNNANLPQEKTLLQRQIQSTDKQIDQLVYRLYDLTDEEIKIVESET
jgi:predicted type IV restriction endonuclease